MGQGCNQGYSNLFQKLVPDTGVKYTGQPIPALGICTGDLLSEVESVILQYITNFTTGTGITIPGIDLTSGSCATLFTDCISCCNTCTDLPCLLKCYYTAICTLYSEYTTLSTEVSSLLNGPYDIGCLQNIPSNASANQIIQELIKEFCSLLGSFNDLNTTVGNFSSGINTTIGTFLTNALTSCQGQSVLKVTNPNTANVQFSFMGAVPVGTILPIASSVAMSKFNSGLGIAGTDMCGWAIANGSTYLLPNGTSVTTENLTGLVPVGATIPGTSPVYPSGAGTPTGSQPLTAGQKAGEFNHTLSGAESALSTHTHGVNDPGHYHNFVYAPMNHVVTISGSTNSIATENSFGAAGTKYTGNGTDPSTASNPSITAYIAKTGSNITIQAAGGTPATNAHNNMQPYVALVYIQRVY